MLRGLLAWSMAVTLLACDSGPTAPEELGEVTAFVEGGTAPAVFSGTGEFSVRRPSLASNRPVMLTISSTDRRGTPVQSLAITRVGSDLPTTGSYRIGGAGGFAAHYETLSATTREGFVAHAGELVITGMSPDRLEGTFRFRAWRHCVGTVAMVTCEDRPRMGDEPVIEVSGSFAARKQ